jgi:GT2 family glycosyltransferase
MTKSIKNRFFERTSHPYYISTPAFRQTSAGIRALHYLCHILNELGYEAYVTQQPEQCSPYLRTPGITEDIKQQHNTAGVIPIAVYPEIISGNPLDLSVVARWTLNLPGHLGGETTYPENDLIFHYNGVILDGILSDRLDMPLVDRRIFHEGTPDKRRNGFSYYAGKYLHFGHIISDEVASNPLGTSLALNIPRTHLEIAEILRSSETFYSYEGTTMVYEALACGCAVAFVDNPYINQFNMDNNPVRFPKVNESEIGKIKVQKISQAESEKFFTETESNASYDIENFIKKTQAAANSQAKERTLAVKPPSRQAMHMDKNYRKWLAQRIFIKTDTHFLNLGPSEQSVPLPSFHLIIRLPQGFETQLADTLDSLDLQIYENWCLDIVSPLPCPEGLEEVLNVGWHTLVSTKDYKKTIDIIASKTPFEWLIELPPGARLDILYLWRLAKEISTRPESVALFVDDDCCDDTGKRFDPRFKPGVNIEALRSADLAGPICVRADIWLASGGASQRAGSPWFEKLLQITDKSGWGLIKHIPDILITYLDYFPNDPESCHLALDDSLNTKGIEGEIRGITAHSWGVRYSLNTPPAVTIAILSTGQFELLKRSLSGALKSTHYPNYEILIVTNTINGDPDFDHWLTEIQTQSDSPNIRVVYVGSDANYATRCNVAIASSDNELVVLTKEETVFVQDVWLEELVAALQQTDIVAAAPLVHQAGNAKILISGLTLGLLGEYESPYAGKASLGEAGYLDSLQVSKDAVALSSACFLIRKTRYQTIGGMDEIKLGDYFAEIDLCLKLHHSHQRVIVHPRASVVYGLDSSQFDIKQRAQAVVKKMAASDTLHQRWGSDSVIDPYWNSNLSLSNVIPEPETEYRAQWQYLPSDKPRILAHAISNGQGDYRVTNPLRAMRKAGLASECVWYQKYNSVARYFTAAEICRLEPTTVIVQNYIHDIALAVLKDWRTLKNRPFIIYTLDDLINDLDKTNPFRKNIPPNARSRFKYALSNCDRLVLSTDFLADTYRHFIDDIKVVPNRLEKDIWLPLNSKKRTTEKPRVGWAGGKTHEGDLILLKEIIEQTREEVDWVFFGMCPETIRPLLAEFHPIVSMDEYPAYLASLNLDIAVAPLAMTPFNQGKSNLRLLEYGALGIPVVCTDIDPYQNSPACRVKNSANAWVAALRERIYDADEREKEGSAMRKWVHNSYLLEDHLNDWLSAHLPG